MQKDIRDTAVYREAEALYSAIRRPGTGQVSDAAELNTSPDGQSVVFAGALLDKLEGGPTTRICRTELESGQTQFLTLGPNTDRSPKFSPDARHVAFLSDRGRAGDFQLYLLESTTGAARPTRRPQGWVEYFHLSPNGKQILLGVAGYGADVAGGQGAITSKQLHDSTSSWLPTVETGKETFRWRRIWVYDLATDSVR